MAKDRKDLELRLNDLFVQNAPRLPWRARRALVAWLPIVAIVAGLTALVSAFGLWHWAHVTNQFIQGVCDTHTVSGCGNPVASRLSVWLWLGVVFVATEGLLYLLAYPGLRDRKKEGWNLLYAGGLLNVCYALMSLFTNYNKMSHFLGGLAVTAIGYYFLFQARSLYLVHRRAHVAAQAQDSKTPIPSPMPAPMHRRAPEKVTASRDELPS